MMIDIDELLFSDKNRPALRTCVAYGLVTFSLCIQWRRLQYELEVVKTEQLFDSDLLHSCFPFSLAARVAHVQLVYNCDL